jgi:hypothetical protein
MSHVWTDTTTRLQIENKTDVTILGLDIVSEDGTSVQSWIRDSIEPGEKSKVVEADWVGTFRVRVRWASRIIQENNCESVLAKEASDRKETDAKIGKPSVTDCVVQWDDKSYAELDFEGGSKYLVVSQDSTGAVAFKFK